MNIIQTRTSSHHFLWYLLSPSQHHPCSASWLVSFLQHLQPVLNMATTMSTLNVSYSRLTPVPFFPSYKSLWKYLQDLSPIAWALPLSSLHFLFPLPLHRDWTKKSEVVSGMSWWRTGGTIFRGNLQKNKFQNTFKFEMCEHWKDFHDTPDLWILILSNIESELRPFPLKFFSINKSPDDGSV